MPAEPLCALIAEENKHESGLPDLIRLQQDFLNPEECRQYFSLLLHEHDWPPEHYEVFGRRFTLPRQQTWHADEGIVYCYSNNLLVTRPWTPLLQALRQSVEQASGRKFNSVLVNLYRSGNDYVGWHTDDDVEMGADPVIASLSLGRTRCFSIRPLTQQNTGTDNKEYFLMLTTGTLLIMEAGFQQTYEHAVLTDNEEGARINLTFRYVYPPAS